MIACVFVLCVLYAITVVAIYIIVRFTFASASPDNIKQWKFPDGNFIQNMTGHSAIINCLTVNGDNVLVSGGEGVGEGGMCVFVCVCVCVCV